MKGLSEADRKLINILQNDGRISLSNLGQILGVSHVAVRRRLQRLIKNGYVRVSAQLSLSKLRLRYALIMLECKNRQAEERIIRRFKDCPRMIFLSRNVGGSLLAVMIAEEMSVLESIASECAIRTDDGVRRSDLIVGSEIVYPSHVPLRVVSERSSPPCGVDCCSCRSYLNSSCLGCPASSCYRGSL